MTEEESDRIMCTTHRGKINVTIEGFEPMNVDAIGESLHLLVSQVASVRILGVQSTNAGNPWLLVKYDKDERSLIVKPKVAAS